MCAFVDALKLAELGFEGVEPASLVGERQVARGAGADPRSDHLRKQIVEPPELIAERLLRFARLVGFWHAGKAHWRWRVHEGVPPTDPTMRSADDRTLGIYFVFGAAEDADQSLPERRRGAKSKHVI
jgi:hypothetical protein